MKVLYVDDDRMLRRLGEHALAELGGMCVVTAADGTEALAVVEQVAPDVILLDYLMPGMDGDEVLAVLRSSSITRSIPVVFLTGVDDADELRRFMAAGAVGCIVKPFDPNTLAETLTSILRGVPNRTVSTS